MSGAGTVYADFEERFTLQTDASEVGSGEVLSQEVEREESLVLCISRKLSPEMAYSVTEKEAIAVKWAVDAFRYYLLGNPFSLVTNHVPLHWLNTEKETKPGLCDGKKTYSFQVCHYPGKSHRNTDYFSQDGGDPGRRTKPQALF